MKLAAHFGGLLLPLSLNLKALANSGKYQFHITVFSGNHSPIRPGYSSISVDRSFQLGTVKKSRPEYCLRVRQQRSPPFVAFGLTYVWYAPLPKKPVSLLVEKGVLAPLG